MSAVHDDATRTATRAAEAGSADRRLGVEVIHHPDPKHIGTRLALPGRGELLLGRRHPSLPDGLLADSRVSRQHARLTATGSAPTLEDLGSHNGTLVDGARIQGAQAVSPGSVIGVGPVLFLVIPDVRTAAPHDGGELVGPSAALADIRALLGRVAPTSTTVLILGETGVGKERVAAEVHRRSGRTGRLVTLNCATVGDGVVQSELFGHVRGAYSGAERPRKGLVLDAAGGTLFLDEIGDASPALQANLLRLLQEREVRAVGSDRVEQVDVRFVAATNVALADAARHGRFRPDLLSRLQRCVVRVPPLRDRRADILPLARHLAARFANRTVALSAELAQTLVLDPWPGNVRELAAIMERLALEDGGDVWAEPSWLLAELAARRPTADLRVDDAQARTERPDADTLITGLTRHTGSVTKLAAELGIGRNTLYRWLKEAAIDLDEIRASLT